jgi:alpha-L-fucosidase
MDTYYKSVGRNSCLLLNFPIAPNGRIHPTDSLRGIAFNKMIHEVFKTDLAKKAKKAGKDFSKKFDKKTKELGLDKKAEEVEEKIEKVAKDVTEEVKEKLD